LTYLAFGLHTSRGDFGHREHFELARAYRRRYRIDEAADAMVATIRHIARLHETADKYYGTIARAWLCAVAGDEFRGNARGNAGAHRRSTSTANLRLTGLRKVLGESTL